jgi:hypothetical protein
MRVERRERSYWCIRCLLVSLGPNHFSYHLLGLEAMPVSSGPDSYNDAQPPVRKIDRSLVPVGHIHLLFESDPRLRYLIHLLVCFCFVVLTFQDGLRSDHTCRDSIATSAPRGECRPPEQSQGPGSH